MAGQIPGLAWQGKLADIEQLVQQHGKGILDTQDGNGRTAAYSAVSGKQIVVLRYVVSQGADVNIAMSKGSTPLHLASFEGALDYVQVLLDAGANASIRNHYGLTALQEAKSSGHSEICQLLEQHMEAQQKQDMEAEQKQEAQQKQAAEAKGAGGPPSKKPKSAAWQQMEEQLSAVLLSAASCTDQKANQQKSPSSKLKTDAELLSVLRAKVEGLDSMYDREGSTPVTEYIIMTYKSGLPLYRSQPQVQEHTVSAVQIFFDQLHLLPEGRQRQLCTRYALVDTLCLP
jgi:hypothetical protein